MAWRTARSIDTLRAQINASFPGRSRASDGTLGDTAHAARKSDHNPDSNGVVRAIDLTHDPRSGMDCNRLAAELVASGDSRIKYVIWNRRIWQRQWSGYGGANPHDKHLHLSVVADARADSRSPWSLPMLGGPPQATPPSEEDDMPGYLISDGHQIYLTDGLSKRSVPFNGQRFQELMFLGQARNSRRPDGGPDIPTMPDYLESIPNA